MMATDREHLGLFQNTPIFPDFSEPQAISNTPSDPSSSSLFSYPSSVYYKRLHDHYQSLVSSSQEYIPPSRPSSPASDARSEALRDKAINAWNMAGGEPTSGKWLHLVWVLRLGCTRGKFVVGGVRPAKQDYAGQDDGRWDLPETEEEWFELERKRAERKKLQNAKGKSLMKVKEAKLEGDVNYRTITLQEKIEGWQAKIGAGTKSTNTLMSLEEEVDVPAKSNPKVQSSKDPSPLGFPVVKRSSLTAVTAKKGKGPARKGPIANPETAVPIGKNSAPARPERMPPSSNDVLMGGPSSSLDSRPPGIADMSEMSFLPPSFPSNLKTSTPQPIKGAGKGKPPPIESLFLSSPPSSPRPSNSLPPGVRPQEPLFNLSSSQPGPSLSPRPMKRPRPLTPPSDDMPAFSTQALSLTPPRANKKARIIPILNEPPVTSPPRSSSLPDSRVVSPDKVLGNAKGLPVPSTPNREKEKAPTATYLLATSRRSKPHPRPPPRKIGSTSKDRREHTPERMPSPTKSYFSSPASGSSHDSTTHQPADSPESPMLSKNMSTFAPNYVSTQNRPGVPSLGTGLARGGSGFFGMGYSSQFDVNRQVDRVSELLEKDVDFDGWLRDVSIENEDQD